MSDFGDRIRAALEKVRVETKRKLATTTHKEASQFLEKGRKKYNDQEYKHALKFFEKAVDADNDYVMAHYYLGLAKYKLNDSEGALRAWHNTIALDKESKYAIKADAKITQHKNRAKRSINQLEDRLKNQ